MRRVHQNQTGHGSKFIARYNVNKLVYAEAFSDPYHAITREKQIKSGFRQDKLDRSMRLILNGKIYSLIGSSDYC